MPALPSLVTALASSVLAPFLPPGPPIIFSTDPAPSGAFGRFLATDGDFAVIADPFASLGPSVYVYAKTGTGWAQAAAFTPDPPDVPVSGVFKVAISGNTVLVADLSADDSRGAAYVFSESAGMWSQQVRLTASDGVAGDQFGFDAAIDGDTAVVGAPGAGGPAGRQGAAYVFTRSAGVWTEQLMLQPLDGGDDDLFGYSVAISGDTIAVCAALHQGVGAVYVYTRDGALWTQEEKLFGEGVVGNDVFGFDMALDADRLVVTAPLDDTAAGVDAGSVFVFARDEGAWIQSALLTAFDAQPFDSFGWSVAIDADVILVGAPFEDEAGPDAGAGYVFRLEDGAWTPAEKLLPTQVSGTIRAGLGAGVGGESILLGAIARVYAFIDPTQAPAPTPTADLNGDGIVDGADLAQLLASWGALAR